METDATTTDATAKVEVTANPVMLPKHPTVLLILTNMEGQVRGMIGSENPILAQALSLTTQLYPSQLRKTTEEIILPLGQDVYVVSRDFVMGVRWLLSSLKESEIIGLDRILPKTGNFTFVVSY